MVVVMETGETSNVTPLNYPQFFLENAADMRL